MYHHLVRAFGEIARATGQEVWDWVDFRAKEVRTGGAVSSLGADSFSVRFNVAITRAKEALIIIGNMNTHKVRRLDDCLQVRRSPSLPQMDPYFNGLLQIATRHNL